MRKRKRRLKMMMEGGEIPGDRLADSPVTGIGSNEAAQCANTGQSLSGNGRADL